MWVWLGLACVHVQPEPEPVTLPSAPLSVEAAIELALHNHPDARIARQRLLGAAANVDLAESAFWPEVSVGARFTRTNAPSRVFGQLLDQGEFSPGIDFNSPGTSSNLRSEVTGGLTLYDGGRRRARLARSEAQLGSSAALEQEVRSLIACETASAWYRVHAARAAAALAAREVTLLEELLARTREELAVGAALPLAVHEREVALSAARHVAHTAESRSRRARAALLRWLGLGIETEVELLAPEPYASAPLESLSTLLERARFQRPELVRAQHEIEAAVSGLREAEAGYFPELGLTAGFGFDDEGLGFARSNWLLGAGLVQSLTEVFRTPERVRREAAEVLIAHEAGRRTLLVVEGEVEAARLDCEDAERVLELRALERRRIEAALRRVEAELESGAARETDLSAARLAAAGAETEVNIAELRCSEARVALWHAVGDARPTETPNEVSQP